MIFKDKTFDFERECSRKDCPDENICEWLNSRALLDFYNETNKIWEVDKTWIKKNKKGQLFYSVRLKNL